MYPLFFQQAGGMKFQHETPIQRVSSVQDHPVGFSDVHPDNVTVPSSGNVKNSN